MDRTGHSRPHACNPIGMILPARDAARNDAATPVPRRSIGNGTAFGATPQAGRGVIHHDHLGS